ncbi:predicted protein [Sclerotinia sclerotiorum 1980 UF-70]|uniref:Uncharacterized protein n=1 Tax=Sclerotinia sclerotiorum (strain ATCC 18683 / 1980 / Ss-1) TaxID=665079 RepID=A7F6G4_SCLS1|nr:predicted protein [Sclerotinia sclerotiorum 1980 UF-70]EDN98335.1 predicted protein [Sclerotinia sclerotiorum 1980 UF-70]
MHPLWRRRPEYLEYPEYQNARISLAIKRLNSDFQARCKRPPEKSWRVASQSNSAMSRFSHVNVLPYPYPTSISDIPYPLLVSRNLFFLLVRKPVMILSREALRLLSVNCKLQSFIHTRLRQLLHLLDHRHVSIPPPYVLETQRLKDSETTSSLTA